MTPGMVAAHMGEKHLGEAMPTPEQTHEGFLATATMIWGRDQRGIERPCPQGPSDAVARAVVEGGEGDAQIVAVGGVPHQEGPRLGPGLPSAQGGGHRGWPSLRRAEGIPAAAARCQDDMIRPGGLSAEDVSEGAAAVHGWRGRVDGAHSLSARVSLDAGTNVARWGASTWGSGGTSSMIRSPRTWSAVSAYTPSHTRS